jgi:hypothetical protein
VRRGQADGFSESDRPADGLHVVHSQDARAGEHRDRAGSHRPLQPLLEGQPPGHFTGEAFAGGSHQHGEAERHDPFELREQGDAVLRTFREAQAGVQHHALARVPRSLRASRRQLQLRAHLAGHVLTIARQLVARHLPHAPARVHQHQPRPVRRRDLPEGGVQPQGRDIVDDGGARRQRGVR